jgi:RecB family endonuclease NucS
MSIYEITPEEIIPFEATSFEELKLWERQDLQRLLKAHIDVVCPHILVIAEGFREWEESRREIDLLAVDKDANLVVIELKRTVDAGHAELQAIRYAAMVSTMTFERAIEVYADYLRADGSTAEGKLLEFLDWVERDEDRFAQDVRIVLVAADFSRELTTSVMWLNQRDLDIRCVRMQPYRDGQRVLLDVQQVIPLPEAQDYIVRIREKAVRERQDRFEQGGRQALRQAFWQGLLERSIGKTPLFARMSPSPDTWMSTGSGIGGVHFLYMIRRHSSAIQLGLEGEQATNKARFDWLAQNRAQLEEAYGEPLDWNRCDDLKRSCLAQDFEGGYGDDRQEWPATQDRMIEAMIRLEKAIQPHMEGLRQLVGGAEVVDPDHERT